MQGAALIFDGICLLIIVLTAIFFSKKGGVVGIFSMAGTLLVAGVSLFGARALASPVFDYFFRDRLIMGLEESFLHQSMEEPRLALEEFSAQLPSGLQKSLLDSMEQIDMGTDGYMELLVNDVVKAIVLPAIVLVLFLIFFALLRPLLTMLLHVIFKKKTFSKLKTPQKVMGALVGLVVGCLYVLVLVNVAAAIAPIMEFSFFQSETLRGSVVYTLLTGWGLFL